MILMDSDELQYAGHDRLSKGHCMQFRPKKETWNDRPYYIQLYIPSRTAIVLICEENALKHHIEMPDYIVEDDFPDCQLEENDQQSEEKKL